MAEAARGQIDGAGERQRLRRHETKPRRPLRQLLARQGRFRRHRIFVACLVSEGIEAGFALERIASLTSLESGGNGLASNSKGRPRRRLDADIALVDPKKTGTIRAKDSASTHGLYALRGHRAETRKSWRPSLRASWSARNGNVTGKPPALPAPPHCQWPPKHESQYCPTASRVADGPTPSPIPRPRR